MNILIIATNKTGGATIAAHRLMNNLKHAGHECKMLGARNDIPSDDLIVYDYSDRSLFRKMVDKLQTGKTLRSLDTKYHYFNHSENDHYIPTKSLLRYFPFKPDVIVVHWATGFINTGNIAEFTRLTDAKVFWYIVDMLPMTGGCHYAWECKGFMGDCSNCPAILDDQEKEFSSKNLQIKQKNLKQAKVDIIAASGELYEQSVQSSLFKHKSLHKVLLSVDPEMFKPSETKSFKQKFNLSSDTKIYLVGARNMNEERKGMAVLSDSLKLVWQELSDKDRSSVFLYLIGRKPKEERIPFEIPFRHEFTGMINNENELSEAYRKSDFFICPSLADSGPMMINESVMSGTPVISFRVGVSTELIIEGKTGFIAQEKNAVSLAEKIRESVFLTDKMLVEMKALCRDTALLKCSPDIQSEKLTEIFKK